MIHPLTIEGVTLPNNLILAPMAGVTDGPFRLVCAAQGVGLTVSELASAKGILMRGRQTIGMIKFQGQQRPYAVQIFGSNPDAMGEAARYVESMGICDMIDLNMGCPVSKVVKTGAGSALMKTPQLAAQIITAVRQAVKMPVTVKCRIGWSSSTINVRDFVKMAIDHGASAVAVHARTKEDGYSGKASWQYLEGLQDLCGKIPFIANGDIHTYADLVKLHEISGCQGFMIGRGIVGKPWLFKDFQAIAAKSIPSENASTLTNLEKFDIFRNHLIETLMEHAGKGVFLFRVHLFNYLRGHPNVSQLRRKLCFERNPAVVLNIGREFFLNHF